MGLALITMTMTPLLAYRDTKHIFMHKRATENACYMHMLGKLRMKLDIVSQIYILLKLKQNAIF